LSFTILITLKCSVGGIAAKSPSGNLQIPLHDYFIVEICSLVTTLSMYVVLDCLLQTDHRLEGTGFESQEGQNNSALFTSSRSAMRPNKPFVELVLG
jgi:hypothetical protein